MQNITCSDAIIQILIKNGVDTIFGIPGAQTYTFFDALHKHQDKIKTYVSRHEQGSAYAAYGYAKSTGKVAAYCVVPGPVVIEIPCEQGSEASPFEFLLPTNYGR